MYEPYPFVALALTGCALAGCGGAPTAAAPKVAGASVMPQQSSARAKQIEIGDLPNEDMRCENLTRPGSRIVVAQRCLPINEEALADQLNQVRREQDELDRLAREREGQRRGAGL
jgi:hypothetical protein